MRLPGTSVRLLCALALAATFARAEEKSVSFAFASQAGTGIYSIEGRLIQIYRVPIDFDVKPLEEEERWGVTMSLPITFGFYDYEPVDVLEGQLPTSIGTASLLAGVAFPVRVTKEWVLSPHADVGAAKDFSGENLVWVYDAGVRSVVSFPAGTWAVRAGQELLWAGAAQTGDPLTDWYGEAKVGFEFRHALPWYSGSSQWNLGWFVVYERYFRDQGVATTTYAAPAVMTDATGTKSIDEQTEIGFSFGTQPKMAYKKLSLPKLGLSYRFGDGVHGVRLIFGEIF